MTKFSSVIHESLKNTRLKKVRINVDPAQCTSDMNSISLADSYEGYILEDDVNGNAVVYVSDFPDDDNMLSLGPEQYTPLPPIEQIKEEAILYLLQKGLINKESNEEIEELLSVQGIRDLEITLRQYNITDSELLSLYRDYFKSEETSCESDGDDFLFEDTDSSSRNIGIFPGKYKIPHVGHYITAEQACTECDEVYIFISPVPQPIEIGSTKPEINTGKSEPPDIIRYEGILAPPYGKKDPSTNKWINNLGGIQPAEVNRPEGLGACKGMELSARYIRKALGERDLNTVKKNLPPGVSFDTVSDIFDDIYEQQQITAEHSKDIWTRAFVPLLAARTPIEEKNIHVRISEVSPVKDTYELTGEINESEGAEKTQILLYVGKCKEDAK